MQTSESYGTTLTVRLSAAPAPQAAAAATPAPAARSLAHKLAGSLLPYGFHWAARQGKMIEQRVRESTLEGLVAEVRALREHLDTVQVRIHEGMVEEKR